MPAYNAALYIRESIESVISQTYTDWELIVVDDGSTDDTLKIAHEFAKQDKRIKVYHQDNKGGCVARNLALKKASGEYIQYLDADDMLDEDKIKLQIESLTDDNSLVLGTCKHLTAQKEIQYSKMTAISHSYVPAIEAQIAIWENHFNSFPYSSYLIPRKIVDEAGQWDERLHRSQDSEYMARILSLSKQLFFVPQAVFFYRQVAGSVSRRELNKKQMRSEMIVCNKIADLLLAYNCLSRTVRACEIHYTDVLTAYYPENSFLANEMLQGMKQRGLKLNFENRGRLFKVINVLFGWRMAVRVLKWKNNKIK